jgi:hypothetical protein
MSYNPSIDHYHIVKEERARFAAATLTAEQCVQVLNSAAQRFQALGEDAGLLSKTEGNRGCWDQCYSVDIIAYPDGSIYDALTDAGSNDQAGSQTPGTAGPAWNAVEPVEADRYRPPTAAIPAPGDGGGIAPEPVPPPAAFVCPARAPTSYGDWLNVDVPDLMATYRAANGGDPSAVDVAHWAWRRFIEWWTLDNIKQDIRQPGSVPNGICSGAPTE